MAKATRSLNVCIAANTTWYVHNFRGRLITQLIEKGYQVTVLSPPDEYIPRVLALGARHVPLHMSGAGINLLVEVFTLLRLARRLRAIMPAVLLTFTPKVNIYSAMVARVLGIPLIANVSGLGRAFIAGGWLEWVARRLYRIAFKGTRCVFFQNEDDRSEFLRTGIVSVSKARRLPGSGVDVDRFIPEGGRSSGAGFVFLFVARLLWDKGLAEYVDAARQVRTEYPSVRFRIVGFLDVKNPSAVSREVVESWVKEGCIEYVGAVEDTRPIYADADCVVLPSYREGVPRVLLEAASMGLPIVTTDVPGCRDTVNDGVTGFLCRPRDAGDLAGKMKKMLCLTDEQRHRMGVAGRDKMCREFDERFVLAAYQSAIGEFIETTKGQSIRAIC